MMVMERDEQSLHEEVQTSFMFDNVLRGVVVRQRVNDPEHLYCFEVDFKLNGFPFSVTVPVTRELVQCDRNMALHALCKAMGKTLATAFLEKLTGMDGSYELGQ